MLSKKIKDMISQNRIDEAIREILDLEGKDGMSNAIIDQVIILSARRSEILKKENIGVIDFQKSEIEKARINQSLLQIVNQISKIQGLDDKPAKSSLVGLEINNYQLLEHIGTGGFGSVYKAIHKYLKRVVAIKISHKFKEGEKYLDNIIDVSINTLKLLDHPNIIKIHDVGVTSIEKSNRLYIVMDFIESGSLRDYMLSGETTTKKEIGFRKNIFRKVCEVLQYAHNLEFTHSFGYRVKGIKHGDIKPENILLKEDHSPVLIDFMLVDLDKLYKISVERPQFLMEDDIRASVMAIGTSGYGAPEQLESGVLSEQSDVYSLGVLLLELMGNITIKTDGYISFDSTDEIKGLIKNEQIPDNLFEIIYKTTRVDPAQRLKSVGEILELL